uniref:Uncharacterized protein n=1 Tax=Daphnia galeata TaxID=27404 RepID=A0A8J2RXR7_9CRUS|nr:unnamed protein product [Daphnia galeata]
MAKIVKSISLLLVVMACCFVRETISTAEEDKREGKQILLSPAVAAPFPFYYYANSPLYINSDVPKSSLEGRVSSKLLSPPDDFNSEAAGRTFFRIFGCPKCPTCPTPVVCPTCPVCPAVAVVPAATITLSPLAASECLTVIGLLNTGNSIAPCTRVSAAPKGTIDVTFNAAQTVAIGIVAASPNTQVKLTCAAIPTGADTVAKTQLGAITVNLAVTSSGFIQILASGIAGANNKLTCSWESS